MKATSEGSVDATKEAYKEKMEAQLRIWTSRLEGVKARADKATAEAKIELMRQAEQLKVFEISAKKHVAEVESSAAETWHKVKGRMEQAWNQLSGSIEAMWETVSSETPAAPPASEMKNTKAKS